MTQKSLSLLEQHQEIIIALQKAILIIADDQNYDLTVDGIGKSNSRSHCVLEAVQAYKILVEDIELESFTKI